MKFMKELKVRPKTSPLEFGDISTIQSINLAYQTCRHAVVPDQQVQQK